MDQWLRSRSDLFGQEGRWSGVAVLSLLLAGLASPAMAATEGEEEPAALQWDLGSTPSGGGAFERGFFGRLSRAAPRAAAAHRAVRGRFGLGLDTFFEHQEGLRIVSMESTVTARDLVGGAEESGLLHGDPRLLNRKFDISWEMEGVGVEFPIVLPRWGRYASPRLFLQAATADATLDFADRTRAEDSGSLEGGATLLGAELSVVTALCQSCPLYAETSYGVRKLPSFTVDRSPRFGPEGFEVLEDEVRLDREVQEIATRIGYNFFGNRATAYTGVLHRWTDLEIEDELQYRDPLGATETRLFSRTELESEATLAVAGVDYRSGRRLSGRFETSAGGGDWGVTFKVVYLGSRREPDDETKRRNSELEKKLDVIARAIAHQLAAIEARFNADWESLAVVEGLDGKPAYRAREVQLLLDRTERDLVDVLDDYPELEALTDWVNDEFRRVRTDLELEKESGPTAVSTAQAPTRPWAKNVRSAQARDALIEKRKADANGDRVRKDLRILALGEFEVSMTFTSYLGERGQLLLFHRRNRSNVTRYAPNTVFVVPMGSYSWELYVAGRKQPELRCDGNTGGPASECPLALTVRYCVDLSCNRRNCKPRNCL